VLQCLVIGAYMITPHQIVHGAPWGVREPPRRQRDGVGVGKISIPCTETHYLHIALIHDNPENFSGEEYCFQHFHVRAWEDWLALNQPA